MYDFAMIFLMLIGFAVLAVILLLAAQIASILMIAIKEIRSTTISSSSSYKPSGKDYDQKTESNGMKNDQAKKLSQPLQVPDLDPFAIAPNLAKPPKAAGEFGHKADNK